MDWIACADQLPPLDQDVLVCFLRYPNHPTKHHFAVGKRYLMTEEPSGGVGWSVDNGEGYPENAAVLFWLPLPPLPPEHRH